MIGLVIPFAGRWRISSRRWAETAPNQPIPSQENRKYVIFVGNGAYKAFSFCQQYRPEVPRILKTFTQTSERWVQLLRRSKSTSQGWDLRVDMLKLRVGSAIQDCRAPYPYPLKPKAEVQMFFLTSGMRDPSPKILSPTLPQIEKYSVLTLPKTFRNQKTPRWKTSSGMSQSWSISPTWRFMCRRQWGYKMSLSTKDSCSYDPYCIRGLIQPHV